MKKEQTTKDGSLGFWELFALAIGQVIGAGVITTIGPAIGLTGSSAWLAYFVAIILGFITNIPLIILSSVTKFSGGDYSVITILAGQKLGGMFILSFFLQMLLMSLMGTSLGLYVNSMFPGVNATLVGVTGIVIFYFVNIMGTSKMASLQKIMSAILVGALLMFVLTGVIKGNPGVAFDFSSDDFFSNGFSGFLSAVMILIYSCQGYKLTVNYGAQARNSTQDMPRSMLMVVPVLMVLYCGAAIADISILPLSEVSGQPLTLAANAMFPSALYYVFMFGAPIMALLTTMNATYGMAVGPYTKAVKDGWLPEFFGKRNQHGAPIVILTIQLVVGVIPVLMGFSVATIVNNIMLITSVFQMMLFIAILKAPGKMPTKWANSTLKCSPTMLKVWVSLAAAVQLLIFTFSAKSLSSGLLVFNIAALIVFITYAVLRFNAGKTHVDTEGMMELD